ncbi:hypothetical protein [Thiohalorhabdus denitrificans]|uniref:Restriction endonuclease n=1 Tax=Thiohalorhabdus denitrificans TaxID=381306 RepID=A0A1G5E5B8_9GAMM|nr:hypothetical protein [Thiohalorhabdus denitrificans]SCY22223.1 hypothetical protein SAMN05661077_1496 [Thiohalorhabdus denitrificans]
MHLDFSYKFIRTARTRESESYVIWKFDPSYQDSVRAGHIDLHIEGKIYHGNIILEIELEEEEVGILIHQIDNTCVGWDRDDFIVQVFSGKEIGYYSDFITEEERGEEYPLRKDIKHIKENMDTFFGKFQYTRSKISEHAVESYFSELGFEAKRADKDLDALKVDVIAESKDEIIYTQVKLGQISEKSMREVAQSIYSLPHPDSKRKSAAFVAKHFPYKSELIRGKLEEKFGIRIFCISLNQIIMATPEYKQSLF